MHYTIKEIAGITNGQIVGNKEVVISNIIIDSRNIIQSPETLFVALKGNNSDGHNFIPDLIKAGINCFLVEKLPYITFDANFIIVGNTLKALHQLSGYHRNSFNSPVIGITGSNGKTIIKEWLFQVLQSSMSVVRSPKSYNSQIGVPLSLMLIEPKHDIAIIEAGISQPGEMAKLNEIIKPNIGIFTNIGDAHQENFENIEQKIDEKLLLFTGCKTLITSCDNILLFNKIANWAKAHNTKLFVYGKTNDANVKFDYTKFADNHTIIEYSFKEKKSQVELPFIDNASLENCLHVLTTCLLIGIEKEIIAEGIKNLVPVAMRLEQKEGINGCTIINDSYNSDLISLTTALNKLAANTQYTNKTLIFSDILQSANNQDELYSDIAKILKQYPISKFIGIGENICKHSEKFDFFENKLFFNNTSEYLNTWNKDIYNNELILLKGSRKYRFEEIVHHLQKKTHQTVLEIDLNAIAHNLNYFKSLLKPGVKILVLVKAFSYGSGSTEIANFVENSKIDYLGVAIADEGVELRKAGITLPIIVLNPDTVSFENIIDYNLEPEIYNLNSLVHFNRLLISEGIENFPVHLKIDTGMHRLGFTPQDIEKLIDTIKKCKNIKVKSIFSHLAASDENIQDQFTNQQIETFIKVSKHISQSIGYQIIRHILNSSGIERFKEAQFEMVRLGIGLYGFSPNMQHNLKQISSFKTHILQVNHVMAGETIGYGRRGFASKDSLIASIPVGYADGLHRAFSNGIGSVVVKGKKAPIIGNICMDMTMIDVTGIDVLEGDEVEIFGQNQPIWELASKINTIPYEILTSISRRVKRVYFTDYQ